MNVLVLIAGVVDPNWHINDARIGPLCQGDEHGEEPRRLSPFDEAALEIALQLRDRDPATHVSVASFGTAGSEKLLRTIAAFRANVTVRIDCPSGSFWAPGSAVAPIRTLLSGAAEGGVPRPDLVLLGREFGDADNGALPPYVAERVGWRFIGQVQQIRAEPDSLALTRTRGNDLEHRVLPTPIMVSVVNDRDNRLRHPLMKNIMLARREPMTVVASPPPGEFLHMRLTGARRAAPKPRSAGCRWLTGSADDQARAIADLLQSQTKPQ